MYGRLSLAESIHIVIPASFLTDTADTFLETLLLFYKK